MSWDDWLSIWERHGRSSRFEIKLEAASRIAWEGMACGRMFLALSGGKDGVALAGVLAHAGINVQAAHCHTELNTPGMLEAAEATSARLNIELDIVEPDIEGTVWDLLARLPRSGTIAYGVEHAALMSKIAAGNMLVSYTYAGKYDGSFSGMRAEESRARRVNRIVRGPLYQHSIDRKWLCSPLVDWSARDVWAAVVRFDLPICPHYQRLYERFDVEPESPGSRVDCLLTPDGIGANGAYTQAKALYPEIWRRLILVRPELGSEG